MGIWRSSGARFALASSSDDPGIGQVQAHVGACRLSAQPDPPHAGILLPERKVGIHKRKRQLFSTVFEVDARIGGRNIGKWRRLLLAGVRGSPWLLQCGTANPDSSCPAAERTRFRLASSTLTSLISSRPRQRESRRMEAVTVLAWSSGSAPNPGSSSTVRS